MFRLLNRFLAPSFSSSISAIQPNIQFLTLTGRGSIPDVPEALSNVPQPGKSPGIAVFAALIRYEKR
jgi:hypothetical protein